MRQYINQCYVSALTAALRAHHPNKITLRQPRSRPAPVAGGAAGCAGHGWGAGGRAGARAGKQSRVLAPGDTWGASSDAFAQHPCAAMLAAARVVMAQGVLDAAVGMGPVPSPRFFAWWEQCRCWHCPVWPCRGWRGCGVGASAAAESSRLCISLY